MASFTSSAFIAILAVLPIALEAPGIPKIIPKSTPKSIPKSTPKSIPKNIFYVERCKKVECGMGKCNPDGSFPLGFSCRCKPGWKRTSDQDDEFNFKFLPCIFPICTLNYGTSQPAPPPIPEKEVPLNISAFDPCDWAYCGEGTCNKNKTYTHQCNCNSGFTNLLNFAALPCYHDCTLGLDCSKLGINVTNSNSCNSTSSESQEGLCKEVECGKGKCNPDGSSPLGFSCQCDNGWKRTRDEVDEDDLKFLPCVIPNCTLNYGTCQPAPPPVPEKEVPRNISAFDPCYWAYCGEGTCTRNKTYTHQCQCNSGFTNLLNITAFPCYSDCTLGSDCSRLGIKVADPTSGSQDGSRATSFLLGKFQWMTMLMVSAGLVLWK